MLRTMRTAGLGVALLALLPSVALAEEGGGLLSPAFDLGIWTIVVFVLLLLVLRGAAWGPLLDGLRKREETIRGSVEEAKRTRDEMERLRNQFKTELDQANAQIPRMMDEARAKAQRMEAEMRAKAAEDIQAEKNRARREIELARDQALQELSDQAARLATLISAKAIGRSLSEEDHRRLLDEALAELSDGAAAHHG